MQLKLIDEENSQHLTLTQANITQCDLNINDHFIHILIEKRTLV